MCAWSVRCRRSLVLKEVENLAQDSARDQRLYRLFGDPRHLDAYRKAQQELPGALRDCPPWSPRTCSAPIGWTGWRR